MGDIIILAILLFMTFLGYKKGFLRTLTGVLALILSFVLAISFAPKIENYIKTTPVYDTIYKNIEETIPAESSQTEDENASKLNMPSEMIKNIQKNINDVKNEAVQSLTEKICDIAIKILSIILIFIAARILIWLMLGAFGFIKKLPLIGWFDRLLGALFGFLRGFLIVYLLLALVMVFTVFNTENPFIKSINHSEFAKVMYNNNVFLDFIKKD